MKTGTSRSIAATLAAVSDDRIARCRIGGSRAGVVRPHGRQRHHRLQRPHPPLPSRQRSSGGRRPRPVGAIAGAAAANSYYDGYYGPYGYYGGPYAYYGPRYPYGYRHPLHRYRYWR